MWVKKKSHLQDLRVARFTFLKRKTALFWLKRPPKSSPLERKLQFDLLDHQEDTQGAVLSHNHCRINHITKSFMGFLAKNVKIDLKLSLLWPLGCLWGSEQNFFFMKYDSTDQDVSFCDKTFVVRPTSDPKKLKFTKICQKLVKNRLNTPLGAILGVRPKFFFTKCFTTSLWTFFMTKVLL